MRARVTVMVMVVMVLKEEEMERWRMKEEKEPRRAAGEKVGGVRGHGLSAVCCFSHA